MEKLKVRKMVEMKQGDIDHINALLFRDTPLPMVEHRLERLGTTIYECPTCGRPMGGVDHELTFCRRCGQRIDTYNIAL